MMQVSPTRNQVFGACLEYVNSADVTRLVQKLINNGISEYTNQDVRPYLCLNVDSSDHLPYGSSTTLLLLDTSIHIGYWVLAYLGLVLVLLALQATIQ
ncbi:MAG: hypothetical protein GFH27_549305n186 [Chloroflexi bacterium AL-W]|nr:hypothetical protein [Chloroflexi bacterium AL-N1]NOK71204.1 hypothetical protein [Chloroflexi bacterium AL-N10]NOK76493.1 hypothetical protein [Chloroflexi bacterium AL-N5]NOK83610.1 hypothetical protein [Chloroflexi bacterium AL-W]NOK92268.1 hypothetical protein [Chloroflexi bacterium AL-N15]